MNDAPPPTFVARANMLEHEAIWRLAPDALELQGGPTASPDTVMRFPYPDIAGVRLSYAPSRADSARYRCDLTMRSGGKVAILSTHYAGFADFEDRGATYAPFVRALVGKVAAANPSARFRSGKNPIVYSAEYLFLFVAIVLLVSVLSMTGVMPLSDSVWGKLFFILGSIPLLLVYTRKNWPSSFKPDAIPKDVLP